MAEYFINKDPCDLRIAGGQLFQRGHAFAFKKGSPLTERVNHGFRYSRDISFLHLSTIDWLTGCTGLLACTVKIICHGHSIVNIQIFSWTTAIFSITSSFQFIICFPHFTIYWLNWISVSDKHSSIHMR